MNKHLLFLARVAKRKLVCSACLPHFRIRAGSPGSPGTLRLGVLLLCERVLYRPPFESIALPLLRIVTQKPRGQR